MLSLAAAIQLAQSRKKMPNFGRSIGALADLIGLPSPVSVRSLIDALGQLPPASVTFTSGPLTAGFVHASASLYLQSDGATAFIGEVREEGEIGDNFLLSVLLLDVKDDAGRTFALPHQDTVVGKHLPGFSEKEWHDYWQYQTVADNWEQIKNNRRYQFFLHASTDVWELTEAGLGLLIGGIALFFGTKEATSCPEGEHWDCKWFTQAPGGPRQPGEPPSVGQEADHNTLLHCECTP